MDNNKVQNQPKSDLNIDDLFSGSELDWNIDSSVENAEYGDSDFDLSCLFEPEPVESTSDRAQALALSKDPFSLDVNNEEDDRTVDMYDDEELENKQQQPTVFESDGEDEQEELTLSGDEQDESEQDESDDETDDDDMDNGARGTVEECWGCRNAEFLKENGLCNRCDKKHFNCAMCGEMNFCDVDTGACHECKRAMEEQQRVSSESESESEDEDNTEEVVAPAEKKAEDGRWHCHDPDCLKSCKKRQDLKFHIMGDARGGHGARFDEEHPLRWRNGVLFIERGWDPYTWKCDHCDDYNGFCKGYVNHASLVKHFNKVHPELPLPEKRPKTPSIKRKRRLEGPSIVNQGYDIQFRSFTPPAYDMNSYNDWERRDDEPSLKRRKEEDTSKSMAI